MTVVHFKRLHDDDLACVPRQRRVARQGGRLRHPGARRGVRGLDQRQLVERGRAAARRDPGPAARPRLAAGAMSRALVVDRMAQRRPARAARGRPPDRGRPRRRGPCGAGARSALAGCAGSRAISMAPSSTAASAPMRSSAPATPALCPAPARSAGIGEQVERRPGGAGPGQARRRRAARGRGSPTDIALPGHLPGAPAAPRPGPAGAGARAIRAAGQQERADGAVSGAAASACVRQPLRATDAGAARRGRAPAPRCGRRSRRGQGPRGRPRCSLPRPSPCSGSCWSTSARSWSGSCSPTGPC